MKSSEFRRWLKKQGVEIRPTRGGSHFKLFYQGRVSVLPDHGSKEIKTGMRKAIIKQLGLKD